MEVSVATADITPLNEVALGCGSMEGSAWTVESPLEIGFVALWFDTAPPLIFVSMDTLYVGRKIRQLIEDGLAKITPPENIVVGATHTHAAPMTDDTKPKLGVPDADHMETIIERISGALTRLKAPENRKECQLQANSGSGKFSVNRRYLRSFMFDRRKPFVRRNVLRVAPSRRGPRDDTFTVVNVVSTQNKLLAVLWNYACHPVSYVPGRTVSAHFPGVVRHALRQHYGTKIPVLYFQGFSGDVRPSPTVGPLIPRGGAYRLYLWITRGRSFVPMTTDSYRKWSGRMAKKVVNLTARAKELDASGYATARVERDREEFVLPQGNAVTFQAMTLGEKFGLAAVSAELVTSYSKQTRGLFRRPFVFCVGCSDDTFGYAPTGQMLGQGGYEDSRYLTSFDLIGINPEIEENVWSSLRKTISAVNNR